jgi:hypothetical protein
LFFAGKEDVQNMTNPIPEPIPGMLLSESGGRTVGFQDDWK